MHTVLALDAEGVPYELLDVAQMAYGAEVVVPVDDPDRSTIRTDGRTYAIERYTGFLIRLIDISTSAPDEELVRRYAGLYLALARLFSSLNRRVINPPLRDCSNFAKPYHAATLARIAHFTTPRSCLASSPEIAKQFIDSSEEGVVFKGASSAKTWATLYEEDMHAARLRRLRNSPVLFQERIVGPDVRVHVVGDRAFAEMIESNNVDYRISRNRRYRPVVIPADVAVGCSAISRFCRTPFMGLDFKIQQETGIWFFLEANPMPCYQGYDERAGGAISRALIELLVSDRAAHSV